MNYGEKMWLLDWFFSDDDKKSSNGPSGLGGIAFIILIILFYLFIKSTFGKVVIFLTVSGIITYFVLKEFRMERNYSKLISIDAYKKLDEEQKKVAYEDILLKLILSKIVNATGIKRSNSSKIVSRTHYISDVRMDYSTGIIYFALSAPNKKPKYYYFSIMGTDFLSTIEISERIAKKISENTISEMKTFLYETKVEYITKRFYEIYSSTSLYQNNIWKFNYKNEDVELFSRCRWNYIFEESSSYFENVCKEYREIIEKYNHREGDWAREIVWFHTSHFISDSKYSGIYDEPIWEHLYALSMNSIINYSTKDEEIKEFLKPEIVSCLFEVQYEQKENLVKNVSVKKYKGIKLYQLGIINFNDFLEKGFYVNHLLLGILYYTNTYVQRDFDKAVYHFYKSFEKENNKVALIFLADCYKYGYGVKIDTQIAGNCYSLYLDLNSYFSQYAPGNAKTICEKELDHLYVNKKWDKNKYDKDSFIEQIKMFSQVTDKVEKFIPKRLNDIEMFYKNYQELLTQENYLFAGKTIRDIVESVVKDIIDNSLPECTFDTTRVQIEKIRDKGLLDEHITSILFNLNQIGNKACHDGGAELDVDKVIIADKVVPDVIEAYRNLAS